MCGTTTVGSSLQAAGEWSRVLDKLSIVCVWMIVLLKKLVILMFLKSVRSRLVCGHHKSHLKVNSYSV